jgi:OOP family OmpA-OmpF porin
LLPLVSSPATSSPVAITSTDPVEADPPDPKRSRIPAALLLGGLGVAAVAGGGLLLVASRDDESVTIDDPTAVTTVAAPETTLSPVTTLAPETTTSPTTTPPTTTSPTTTPPTTAPAGTVSPTGVPGAGPGVGEVAESKAIVRNGQIFLEGAVPTAEAGAEIAALAAEILGPGNVFNSYVVDPRAGDPNLGNITVEDTISFATDSSVILPGSETLLNQGLALFTIRPSMTLVVVGHTDDRGSAEHNQQLSLDRADAVVRWFADRGVDPTRITARGAGESEPLGPNDTPDGRRQNRRIQFFLENILG